MTTPHKHVALIKQWADGAQIQFKVSSEEVWKDIEKPSWHEGIEYRVKPTDRTEEFRAEYAFGNAQFSRGLLRPANLRLTFDAETGALKSAEVIK